jgi:glycerol uptake facilitator-like aquaporin
MGTFLLILVIFGSVAGIELPGIIKKKQRREFGVFVVFLTIGFALTTMHYVFQVDFSFITAWFIKVFSWWK